MTKQLTEQQYAAIEWLALPNRGGKTIKEIADEVGVSDRTVQRWRTDEQFVKAVARRVMIASQDRLPELMAKANDAFLTDGNAALLRVILQSYGLLTDKVEVKSDAAGAGQAVDMAAIRAEIARMRNDK
ncbi:phBC6A51 family helix-turn-helix protein [Planococcus sp. FY231025]|uniref:phBC6A51 family helix-turn-helix protein n=1 Tax=Planococcus sp. FY231025 TaxID=3455699 RepID=UPI003F939250